jgi:hypothetical protein
VKIQVFLKVKFRAFRFTLAEFSHQWEEILPVPPLPEAKVLVDFNDRGVKLFIKLVQA